MQKILIFSGTSEGRRLSEWLSSNEVYHTVCVATEYGELVMKENEYAKIMAGRMNEMEMATFIRDNGFEIVIDATHPYASEVTANIKNATAKEKAKYIRLLRGSEFTDCENVISNIHMCEDAKKCASYLSGTTGNILLTTGSKELDIFTIDDSLRERLYVRVLPGKESIDICEKAGIHTKQIIALQGPFSKDMNVALINQYNIKVLVTKDSGTAGGFSEKIAAAAVTGCEVVVIGRPLNEEGYSYEEVIKHLSEKLYIASCKIKLVGCGMGNDMLLTKEAKKAIDEADVIFGAKRLLLDLNITKKSYPYYLDKDIIPILQKESFENTVVLFSGDTGFYSGATKMQKALIKACSEGTINVKVEIIPGISSVSYLAAKTGNTYSDSQILSIHGRGAFEDFAAQIIEKATYFRQTYVLVSGAGDVKKLIELLPGYELVIGYNLGLTSEKIVTVKCGDTINIIDEGLYCVLIKNDNPEVRSITHGMPDSEFIRDKVPMTKEEVRTISISKLKLKENAVVYDIGSGTGSIAVEIAKLCPSVKVYAIEQKDDALELIKKNVNKFNLKNVEVVCGSAPEALASLDIPTHAFIGGTSGNMERILDTLFDKNPLIRVVANAVSVETIDELIKIKDDERIDDYSLVSITVARTKEAGKYHMMQSENPVWICSFSGK